MPSPPRPHAFFSLYDEYAMWLALLMARRGAKKGEVPVGAVLVTRGESGVSRRFCAHNLVEERQDPTAHAETLVIQQATRRLGRAFLPKKTTLYVTLEPCIACCGAILNARIDEVIFAARESRTGGARSHFSLLESLPHLHKVTVHEGLYEAESQTLLRDFFASLRTKNP